MKTRILFSVALVLTLNFSNFAQCPAPSGKTCVPDNQFEAYLESIGIGDDIADNDLVFTSRIETITDLDVSNKGIQSMDGIEDFTALQTLNCSSNVQLSSLNVFENRSLTELRAFNCDITSLTLPDSNTLTYLSCSNNNLPGLDVSAYTILETLICANNGSQDLGSMDLTPNSNLLNLQLHNSGVTSINITNCPNLNYLTCFNNFSSPNPNSIASLDISSNTALTHLRCYGVGMNTLTTSVGSYNSMTYLDCGDNNLSSLDPTKFPNIETLWCYYNNLSSLDLSNNSSLKSLDCGGNSSITNINLSMLPNLEYFWGYENNFSSIDANSNSQLIVFNSNSNPNLTNVDLPSTTTLEEVYVCCSNLSSLDFVSNTGIQYLDVGINSFTELDVSMLGSLVGLWCNQNQLTYLNIANGNIDGLITMRAQNNANGLCIQVDDLAKATAKSSPNWQRDPGSSFSVNCGLSLNDEVLIGNVLIYPNPSNNIINVDIQIKVNYTLTNIFGQDIRKGNMEIGVNELDVKSLANGMYFLNLETPNGRLTKKIIKK